MGVVFSIRGGGGGGGAQRFWKFSMILLGSENYLVFSGIGNPADFHLILIKNKIKIGKEIIFPDHYNYKINDIKKIKNLAKTLNLSILTTEKDFVKLSHLDKKNIKYLALDLKIKNEKQFLNFIKSKLYE